MADPAPPDNLLSSLNTANTANTANDGGTLRGRAQLSAMAIALTIALIAGSVSIGILGPQLPARATNSSLRPLGEFAAAAVTAQRQLEFDAAHRLPDAPLPIRANVEENWSATSGAPIPDLESRGYRLVGSAPLVIAGEPDGLAVLYEGTDETPVPFILIASIADGVGWAMYDRFGQAQPIAVGETVLETPEGGAEFDESTLVWCDGTTVFLARCSESAALDDLREALGSP
ncbi:MAG: hypothetical protein EXS00_06935 [Phycisphaerales bacterium]|nr:hypothetical protein [Phycisphaerales bacterium]